MQPVLDTEIAWIREDVSVGRTIRSAVPAGYEVYGVLDLPEDLDATEDVLLEVLAPSASEELLAGWIERGPWMTEPGIQHVLYSGWHYRLRRVHANELKGLPAEGKGSFPDLLFPPDHSWFISLLWDDSWRSIGTTRHQADQIERALPSFERIATSTDIASTGRQLR